MPTFTLPQPPTVLLEWGEDWIKWLVRLSSYVRQIDSMKQRTLISAIDWLVSPAHTNGVFAAANLAFFIPFTVFEQTTIKRVIVPIQALGAGGNIDVGIYNSKKVRKVSSGSVPVMGAFAIAINIVNEVLDPGNYYMAISLDNTAVSVFAVTVEAGINREVGVFEKTTSFPLPATATFNENATRNYIPNFALDTGGGQITTTFVGASADIWAANGNLVVTPPATLANDILICAESSFDNVPSTFPAGWTIYHEANDTAGLRETLAWKRATGVEAPFTITHVAGGNIEANVAVYRGCVATGSPINAFGFQDNGAGLVCTAPTITPTVPNCLIVFTTHPIAAASSNQAATDPATFTERFQGAAGVSAADGFNLAGAATGVATADLTTAVVSTGCLTALTPLTK